MAALTKDQIDHFHEHGYVIAPDVVTEDDLAPVIAAVERHIDQKARRYKDEGKINDLCEDAPFEKRVHLLHKQAPDFTNAMDIQNIDSPELLAFMGCPNLMQAVGSLVGPRITLNPIQHIRPKLPAGKEVGGLAMSVPWHQDIGVMWEEADDSNVVTCWMPLIDATRETGCMGIIPGYHKKGYLEHEVEGGTRIKPELTEGVDYIAAECPRRGAVFMTRYTPHCGLENTSDRVRWTLDLRYQPTGQPTGRPFLPAFVLQDPDQPANEQRDFEQWRTRWRNAAAEAKGVKTHRVYPKEERVWTKGQV